MKAVSVCVMIAGQKVLGLGGRRRIVVARVSASET